MATHFAVKRHRPATLRRPVDWRDSDDVTAITMVALGWSARVIQSRTGLTSGQIEYRKAKANIRTMDYRQVKPGTIGGQIANEMLKRAVSHYRAQVQKQLPMDLHSKRATRALIGSGNGNGHH
jgi:hypothetical protein